MTAALHDRIDVFMAVKRAERPARRAAFSLSLPLQGFLLLAFFLPIAFLLIAAVGNPETRQILPQTLGALEGWDGTQIPPDAVFEAFEEDLKAAHANRTAALLGKRLNYEVSGSRSAVVAAGRLAASRPSGSFKDALLASNPMWGTAEIWSVIKRNGSAVTPYYLLMAVDLTQSADGLLRWADEDQGIFLAVLGRTLLIALMVTIGTLLLGYPVAYVLTLAPRGVGSVMLLMVLLPLWTSLLVRTTAWVALLQTDGVINDVLMFLGLIDEKVQLIYTRVGTVTAMTHIQLPFTILPIYSVMRAINPSHVRAARSLGAGPLSAFWRVYAPQTLPGVVAGCLMTFILSLGYYITPALVGGANDQMVSNLISIYINRELNWGMAAALGVVLLTVTVAIYALFLRLVGADKIRLG
ncbi:ABC transporter permease [Mesorhizobium sp. KR1-2]|uniref:ABC transporter permease n=1 Tax=Mesorhizobium sp. KR1-2 TaxID=3156609 RepID=UPI0032B4437A